MSQVLIDVDRLSFAYPDGTPALREVSLQIREGEFVALIGQNGSGKTTLAKCFNGLYRPSRGRVLVEGLDTAGRGIVKRLVTKVGYVFQNPDHQLFNTTVYDEIAYGPRNLGAPAAEVEAVVREAAQVVGIRETLFSTHPFFLPKGLRQRVALASILAMRPRTIIVDEPTTGQDRRQSLEIMGFLRRLWEQEGHTVIIITHEMPIVAAFARRTIALCQGEILIDGPTREVFARPDLLARTFVQPPQITRFAQALGDDVPPGVLAVEEMLEYFTRRLAPAPPTGTQAPGDGRR